MPRDDSPRSIRDTIDAAYLGPEADALARLTARADLSPEARRAIGRAGADYVRRIRAHADPGLMEVFLAEYGLSTDEGIALMCLAEALLRVPDAETIDALIEDKIAPSDWGRHLGRSHSPLVNASTWALMLTGRVLDEDRPAPFRALRGAVKRLGEPVIRSAVGRAMREMGRQFVLGEDIGKAMKRAEGMQRKGYTYSYDMLGEAARTAADARAYHLAYSRAISAISDHAVHGSVAANPGISVKLSALHPRYEIAQRARVMDELVPRVRALAGLAASAGMGFNIDAEEADRLSLSLDVIDACLADGSTRGWDGFGVVVQAYGPRAGHVIDWLHDAAGRHGRRIMVRLVKGAYWDAEIKRAQVEGLEGFPVFTEKAATDVSYLGNAARLLSMTDRIYPQFATHNAHTVAAVLHMAQARGVPKDAFEFQRLHGMGETLHDLVMADHGTRCRIYAPVGAHEDLLAYLVRRLLENGANSSFVNQIVDEEVPPETVAADPWDSLGRPRPFPAGPDLFGDRRNSAGWDLTHAPTLAALDIARAAWREHLWGAAPILAEGPLTAPSGGTEDSVTSPVDGLLVGRVVAATPEVVRAAHGAARTWDAPVAERAATLRRAADAYEEHAPELFALLAREAGKALPDAVAELREAVDFLRYYAAEAEAAGEAPPRGIWGAISPWNFPLAIFSGQIAAALATGNAVLAKPAGQTPLTAARAVALLHGAGVPRAALQLLPGGPETGAALTALPLDGVAFTGSTATSRRIRESLAEHAAPGTPLIAETGGINAMIVDSTALPEHAVRDIVMGAFRSAGQRCSALRCLYVQEDVEGRLLTMLKGAMDELSLGDPWHLATDVGPVIDHEAAEGIRAHVETARAEGRLLHELPLPASSGHYIPPTILRVKDIAAVGREVFGPVLHVATFRAGEIDRVVADINAMGYGLTFGLHTRIDDRVEEIVTSVEVGNLYVNRNQIGAIVGSQPFGGEGLSGTGPKAGGPHYLPRFRAPAAPSAAPGDPGGPAPDPAPRLAEVDAAKGSEGAVRTLTLPGPTGESNRLSLVPRPPILCAGPGAEAEAAQAEAVAALGGRAVRAGGAVKPAALTGLRPLSAVIWWGDADTARAMETALAARDGKLVPLITAMPDAAHALHERHVCIDTTAAGGNAALLAEVAAV
ncbi:bifunctional proline dehydrogenase/L-glutamate gamma-semialdehyde dehydrogenase PutA [Wenxinia saemankumensis]|uniref:Bifunctional protein PutA n=1 Tax=Wenxinia saemankumensis TaxID=1447782 RepID=A0A1M6CNT2_9RHOB|nr:bifunctional proline dehydrogenase/L-glutamate gamma-semialdehyde dehydrogenase PutA [Wenxinia saemankumensis]SHI62692.1 L-proline dehydrogenase /delta-1-pyrroline-5-carboxylate dehydrogenase [Wenxinia saemankumensis]